MKIPAIALLICLGLAATTAAQGAPQAKSDNSARASKAQLSEIRTVLHELQRATGKLTDLMSQYRSMIEQRPQAKKGSEPYDKWSQALDRLVRRIGTARTTVFDMLQHLKQVAAVKLPTSLGKDVANGHNEAEAVRADADQVLAKHKPAPAKASKSAKKAPAEEDTEPPPLGDIDDL